MIRFTIEKESPSRAKLIQYLLDMGWYQKFPEPDYNVREGFEDYSNGKYYVEIPLDERRIDAYAKNIIEYFALHQERSVLDVYNDVMNTPI